MKKLLTILALAALLCLVCSAALADTYPGSFDSPKEFEAALLAHTKVTSTGVAMEKSDDWTTVLADAASYDHATGYAYVHVSGWNSDPTPVYETVVVRVKMHAKGLKDNAASVAPTCTSSGKDVFKCTVPGCTEVYVTTLPANGTSHTYEDVITKNPTCNEAGTKDVKCSGCGNVLKTDVPVPALGHDYVLTVTAPICDADTKAIDSGKAAWSTKCANGCGKSITDAIAAGEKNATKVTFNGKLYTVNAAQAANIANKSKQTITNYNAVFTAAPFSLTAVTEGHKWGEKEPVAATCTSKSGVQQLCQNCGERKVTERTDGVDDRLAAQYVIDWAATAALDLDCSVSPTATYVVVKCALCNGTADDTKTKEGDHKAHVTSLSKLPDATVTQKIGAATINLTINKGYYGTKVNADGEVFALNVEHKFTSRLAAGLQINYSGLTDAQKCTTDKYGYYKCSVPGCNVRTYLIETKAPGHKFGDWTIDKQIGEDIVWKRECDNCHTIVTKYSKTKPVDSCGTDDASHTWDYKAGEKAKLVCGKEVEVTKYCIVCGTEKAFKETQAHNPIELYRKPATCKEDGELIEKCEYCGLSFETVLKKEDVAHTPGAPIITEATLEKEGSKVIKCSVCGATISTEVLPKLVPAPKYTLTADYSGSTVTGKLEHVAGTQDADVKNIRVTFYIEGNYYMATMAEVAADGTFSVDGVGPIKYITVAATGNTSVNPEDYQKIAEAQEIFVK